MRRPGAEIDNITDLNKAYFRDFVDPEKVREQHQEPTEDIHVHVLEPEQVLEMLQDGEIIQALHAAPLWKFFAQK